MGVAGLVDLFFPPVCVACAEVLPAAGFFFCETCAPTVTQTPSVHCARCGEPGRFQRALCPRCTAHSPSFDCAFAPFEHEGAVAKAIHAFKYGGHSGLSKRLADAMVKYTPRAVLIKMPGTICPLPVHDARYRERGYDQATLLAVAAATALGRPFEDLWLTRVRATSRQVGLSEAAREANVHCAFEAAPAVKGHAVVLIDDVLTTGATAREAARCLKAAGAATVSVLTLARARRESLALS